MGPPVHAECCILKLLHTHLTDIEGRPTMHRLVSAAMVAVVVASTPTLTASNALASSDVAAELLVPNLVQSGVPTTLVAEVAASGSTSAPAGTVTFATGYGTTLGTAALVPTSSGTARATLAWTPPPAAFTVPLIARYTPAGSTSVAATSDYARPVITSAPVAVAIRLTPKPQAGAISLEAVLGHGFGTGSVTFFVDGKGWTGSIPTENGVSTLTWNATPGVHTILIQYSSTANNPAGVALQTGTSTQMVEVLP